MLRRQISAAFGLRMTPVHVTTVPFAPRFKRYQAFDAELDQDALAEARTWFNSFNLSQLPKGNTTYARSSGPGGQHVNKYDSRSRDANAEDNRRKLVEEVTRIYEAATPAETSVEKRKKYEEIGKRFHDSRMKQKKFTSAKKQSRRGPSG
ncbi:hypothetical protein FSARC_8291 [Fusarium sarcochroum]|uniref:Prokaryotic-type class I peptide chain release factors domain-containing protein n=1 Tax=Fusarium sarcochroum TaxID=1208366 RepID=A0A8H4X7D7_9HYPO|nr:hypothetical protein FSARC_8291 [Fusarium sarcochroum]